MSTTLTCSADIIGFTCGMRPVAGIRTGFKTPVPEPFPLSPPAVGLGAGLMGWPPPMIGGLCVPLPVAGTVVGPATGSVLPPSVAGGLCAGLIWPPVMIGGLCVPLPVFALIGSLKPVPKRLGNLIVPLVPFWFVWPALEASGFFLPPPEIVASPKPLALAVWTVLISTSAVVASAATVRVRTERIFAILVIVVSWCVAKSFIALSWSGA